MPFTLALQQPTAPPRITDIEPLKEDFESLIIGTCGALARTDCRFSVSGFGDNSWPVDIDYDLAAVLQQTPDLIEDLRAGDEAGLDFYSPHLERNLEFAMLGDLVEITCTSDTGWKPDPGTEYVPWPELERMLTTLAQNFANYLYRIDPALDELWPLPDWRRGTVPGLGR
ncbi:hypothetical protein [Amycolatopsis sp. NPDC059657]|uniref:hypothetical protein n=1 Tax=Amycolatopsis sp. NPDC059657 TaxID=3346899 RepID=UPI003671A8F5